MMAPTLSYDVIFHSVKPHTRQTYKLASLPTELCLAIFSCPWGNCILHDIFLDTEGSAELEPFQIRELGV